MAGSPSRQCPAPASRVMTSRTWQAVTSAASSSGPRRTASSTAVHEVRPLSSAATTEYGQPGIICACPFPRPYTWQNSRSGLVAAPGRSQLLTSTASISRPSAARGNGRVASDRRSRAISTRPWLTASDSAPCPRWCSAASDKAARHLTGPAAHSTASASSHSSSARAVRHPRNSRRNPASTATGPAPASSGKLSITAFAGDHASLARTHDHAKAVFTHPTRREHLAEGARNAQVTAEQVKEQAKSLQYARCAARRPPHGRARRACVKALARWRGPPGVLRSCACGVGLPAGGGGAHPYPGDAAGVHLRHGQPLAVDLDRVTHRWQPPQGGENIPGHRLVRSFRQADPGLLGELVEVEQAVHLDLAAVQPARAALLGVVFVLDIPDELLHQVFQGHDPRGAAVLVHHDRQV